MQKFFKDIYDNYYSELCIYARRFVKTDEDAEEMVQEVIYKLWESKDKLDQITSLRAYLYRAVYNKSINYLNRLVRENKYKDEAWIELKKYELSATDKILETELKEKINSAINALPERCKEVFELSRFTGLKNKEIAEQLDISLKAVEANISRALTSLRKSLKEYLTIEMIIILLFFVNHM